MAVARIRLLGDPILRKRCRTVRSVRTPAVRRTIRTLRDTLGQFRKTRGFGRGIAAPQIGSAVRIIYIDYAYSGALINPRIVRKSAARFDLWDDCFSFPDLLVWVRRHTGVTVSFLDETGTARLLQARGALAELLQHEIDHLDGILAVDRAKSASDIILRSERRKARRGTRRT